MITLLEQKINNWSIVWIWYEWEWNLDGILEEEINLYNIYAYTIYFRNEARKVLGIQDYIKYNPQHRNKKIRNDIVSNYFIDNNESKLPIPRNNKRHYENINNMMDNIWINNMQELISKTDQEISNIIGKLWYHGYNIILSLLSNELKNEKRYNNIKYISNTVRFEKIKLLFKNNETISKFLEDPESAISKQEKEEIYNYFLSNLSYDDIEKDLKNRFVLKQRYESAAIMRDIDITKEKNRLKIITDKVNL